MGVAALNDSGGQVHTLKEFAANNSSRTKNLLKLVIAMLIATALLVPTELSAHAALVQGSNGVIDSHAQSEAAKAKELPYIVGLNGSVAQKLLKKAGYDSKLKDATKFNRRVELPSSWIVALQPEPITSKEKTITLLMTYRSDPADVMSKDASSADFYDDTVVPKFIGMQLDEAKKLADSLEFNLESEDESQGRGIWNSSNWVVTSQSIEPGRGAGVNTYIDVTAIKKGEKSSIPRPLDQHIGEMQFFGRVTGYSSESTGNSWDKGIIIVDGATLSLDLIWPTDAACLSELSTENAVKAKEKLFPVGAKVNVIRGDAEHTEDAFISIKAQFDQYKPFDNSGNEKLVSTGFWVPSAMGIESSEIPYNPSVNYALQTEYLTPVQHQFALQIVEAGNAAKAARVGDTGTCLDEAAAYQTKVATEKQAIEDEIRRNQESGVYGNTGGSSGGSSSSGSGYVVLCRDGTVSNSGGRRGACSHHGGVAG